MTNDSERAKVEGILDGSQLGKPGKAVFVIPPGMTDAILQLISEVRGEAYDKGFEAGRFNPPSFKDMSAEEKREYNKQAKRRERLTTQAGKGDRNG